jgi:hypothetical protein
MKVSYNKIATLSQQADVALTLDDSIDSSKCNKQSAISPATELSEQWGISVVIAMKTLKKTVQKFL